MPTGSSSAVINGPMNWHSLVDALVATMLPTSTVTTGLELEFSALATASTLSSPVAIYAPRSRCSSPHRFLASAPATYPSGHIGS